MSSSQHNLTLDEQSFQGLLAAAFIIQEHNDRRKVAQPAPAESEDERVGRDRGTVEAPDGSRSESSGHDEFRPGERLQRNWASMWLMSQERGLWPERSAEIGEAPQTDATPLPAKSSTLARAAGEFAASNFLALPVERKSARETFTREKTDTFHDQARGRPALAEPTARSDWITEAEDDAEDFAYEGFALRASDDALPIEANRDESTAANPDTAAPVSFMQRFADWRVKLRFRRADLYLGTAVFVAALALLWPVAGSRRAPLSPWERALVTLGIAEAPAPVIHLQGDPGISVWVDPHTALYYCPGEEQYGKTSDGRMSSQREAQMDRFEPAGRSACE